MNNLEKLKENLNVKQLEAVTETEGFVRVIAGAGSGKTKALTSRYAYIVEALGVNSSNILCVTFTNKAAQEMRKRVKKLVGEDSDLSLITTYHGFCVRVLKEDINKIQYPKNFIIMDVEDQKTVLREVFRELGIDSKTFTFKQVIRYISKEKSSQEYLQFILESKKSQTDNEIEKIFIRYLEKQQRNYALDFDDLINFALYIFENHSDVLGKWQKKIHYIQVDETQDSSEKQFRLMRMLSEYHKNLFVVGDPDQTIYEWRGAKPEILVNFDKMFADSKTVIMDQNYRSTPNILKLGNHIIKNNKIRVDKDMFTENIEGVDVVHFHAKNDVEEGQWIANEIKRLVGENDEKYSHFAILYRANYISRIIEQSLIKEGIPYSIFGGIRFFERKEIKDILAYLRLIEFGDDFSFLRVINVPTRGLGNKFIESLIKIAEKENSSLLEALEKSIAEKEIVRAGSVEFIKLINRIKGIKSELNISDLVKELLDESGLSAYYRADGDTERLDNIKEFQNSIIILEKANVEKLILEEYLQEIALYTDMDIENDKYDRVKLMTIHTSKGLEYPYVFLCGFTEGVLPSAMSIKERRGRAIEEERRLTYVAVTRAEKGFYMTESEGYNFTIDSNKYPSRFLFEINEQFFVRKGELSQEIIEEANSHLRFEQRKQSAQKKFDKGEFVNHSIWNAGKIVDVDEVKKEYSIEFFEKNIIRPINFDFNGLTKIKANICDEFRINASCSEPAQTKIIDKSVLKELNLSIEAISDTFVTADIEQNGNNNAIEKGIHEAIIEFAKKEYPENIDMQSYIYNEQIVAFFYMKSVNDPELKKYAVREYPMNFVMQQYGYEEQVKAKAYMATIKDAELKEFAVNEYPDNYSMQQYTYDIQVVAKAYMQSVTNIEIKLIAQNKYPQNYDMQQYTYDKLTN